MTCENGFQFCRGTLEQIRKQFEDQSPRGEITLVIEGIPQSASKQILSEEEIEAQLGSLIAAGISPSEVTSTRVSPPNSSLFPISCSYGHFVVLHKVSPSKSIIFFCCPSCIGYSCA
jgi:hypothetical protein